jgi:hypothetical protein
MRTELIGRLKKEKDGRQNSPMVKGPQVNWWTSGPNRSADGRLEDRSMERKKAVHQKESTVEAGQSMIGDGSKSQFRKFWLLQEPFSIFSKYLFSLDASKQCRNRLGAGLSSGHK